MTLVKVGLEQLFEILASASFISYLQPTRLTWFDVGRRSRRSFIMRRGAAV